MEKRQRDDKATVSPLRPLIGSTRREQQASIDIDEWCFIFGAMRYFMGRATIASATFPESVIRKYHARMNENQKAHLVRDLREHLESGGGFGWETIDAPVWNKFLAALDEPNHFQITAIDDTTHVCFRANERTYSVAQYLREPNLECYLPPENIKHGGAYEKR